MSTLVARPSPELDALVHRATALVLYARQLLGSLSGSPMSAEEQKKLERALLQHADNADIDAAAVLEKAPAGSSESIPRCSRREGERGCLFAGWSGSIRC